MERTTIGVTKELSKEIGRIALRLSKVRGEKVTKEDVIRMAIERLKKEVGV